MSAPTILPDSDVDVGPKGYGGWVVTVFNNDDNTYDEVILILMAATGCSPDEAFLETWEIDHLGKSVVHHGAETECLGVAGIISTIGLRVEVSES